MTEPEEAGRRAQLVAAARKQLDDGLWPEVMTVFSYVTPRATMRSQEEFDSVKNAFEKAGLNNIPVFIDFVRMEERRHGTAMSFNLSMRRRMSPEDATNPELMAKTIFSSPDIMVGTRGGIESAFEWLRNLSQAMERLPQESMEIFDKIFGEANEHMKVAGKPTTLAQMIKEVMTPAALKPVSPPETGSKPN